MNRNNLISSTGALAVTALSYYYYYYSTLLYYSITAIRLAIYFRADKKHSYGNPIRDIDSKCFWF